MCNTCNTKFHQNTDFAVIYSFLQHGFRSTRSSRWIFKGWQRFNLNVGKRWKIFQNYLLLKFHEHRWFLNQNVTKMFLSWISSGVEETNLAELGKMLNNQYYYLVNVGGKIGFDTADDEPCEGWQSCYKIRQI